MKTFKYLLLLTLMPTLAFASSWEVLSVKYLVSSNQEVTVELTAKADSVYREESFVLAYYKVYQQNDTLIVRPYYFASIASSGNLRSVQKTDQINLGVLPSTVTQICVTPYNIDEVDTVAYPPTAHPPNFCILREEVSVANQSQVDDFQVFPNPVADYLYLNTNKNINAVAIYSLTGQLLIKEKSDTHKIFMQKLPTGNYILRIETDTGTFYKRVIKE